MITWAKKLLFKIRILGLESQPNHFLLLLHNMCFHNNIGKAPDRDTAHFLFILKISEHFYEEVALYNTMKKFR